MGIATVLILLGLASALDLPVQNASACRVPLLAEDARRHKKVKITTKGKARETEDKFGAIEFKKKNGEVTWDFTGCEATAYEVEIHYAVKGKDTQTLRFLEIEKNVELPATGGKNRWSIVTVDYPDVSSGVSTPITS